MVSRVALTGVEPTVIVEVAADNAAREYGVWRHGLRSIRLRADLTVSDLAVLDAHGDTASNRTVQAVARSTQP